MCRTRLTVGTVLPHLAGREEETVETVPEPGVPGAGGGGAALVETVHLGRNVVNKVQEVVLHHLAGEGATADVRGPGGGEPRAGLTASDDMLEEVEEDEVEEEHGEGFYYF